MASASMASRTLGFRPSCNAVICTSRPSRLESPNSRPARSRSEKRRAVDLGDQIHIALPGRFAASDRTGEPQAPDAAQPKLVGSLLQHPEDPLALRFADLNVSRHYIGPSQPSRD